MSSSNPNEHFHQKTPTKGNHFVLLYFCLHPVCSQVSSDSVYLDDKVRVAAKTCACVEHHVAEIAALLIKELGCSVFPERRRMFVQDPFPFLVVKIVNATTPRPAPASARVQPFRRCCIVRPSAIPILRLNNRQLLMQDCPSTHGILE